MLFLSFFYLFLPRGTYGLAPTVYCLLPTDYLPIRRAFSRIAGRALSMVSRQSW